jgi:hypothetical protein
MNVKTLEKNLSWLRYVLDKSTDPVQKERVLGGIVNLMKLIKEAEKEQK